MTNKEKFKNTLDSLHKELCDVSDWMYHCLLYTSDAADE